MSYGAKPHLKNPLNSAGSCTLAPIPGNYRIFFLFNGIIPATQSDHLTPGTYRVTGSRLTVAARQRGLISNAARQSTEK